MIGENGQSTGKPTITVTIIGAPHWVNKSDIEKLVQTGEPPAFLHLKVLRMFGGLAGFGTGPGRSDFSVTPGLKSLHAYQLAVMCGR